jgi:hypothetical protein
MRVRVKIVIKHSSPSANPPPFLTTYSSTVIPPAISLLRRKGIQPHEVPSLSTDDDLSSGMLSVGGGQF